MPGLRNGHNPTNTVKVVLKWLHLGMAVTDPQFQTCGEFVKRRVRMRRPTDLTRFHLFCQEE
uniref:Uncharacterized protein n=1 Tax=Xiphophorus maculatus TaxID=8083 RepID=A0A3B5QK97_XIPMA